MVPVTGGRPHDLYALTESPLVADLGRKLDLLKSVDAAARAADSRVRQVIVSLTSEDTVLLLSTGQPGGDIRPLTRLNVTVIAEDGTRREIGTGAAAPASTGWRALKRFAVEAARQAILKLRSNTRRANMTVGLGPGRPGTCCTKRSAMAWRVTSTARALRRSRAVWVRKWRRSW